MFSQMSVILAAGQIPLPLWMQTPPLPELDLHPRQTRSMHTFPGGRNARDGHCSGLYESYLNAFLSFNYFFTYFRRTRVSRMLRRRGNLAILGRRQQQQ